MGFSGRFGKVQQFFRPQENLESLPAWTQIPGMESWLAARPLSLNHLQATGRDMQTATGLLQAWDIFCHQGLAGEPCLKPPLWSSYQGAIHNGVSPTHSCDFTRLVLRHYQVQMPLAAYDKKQGFLLIDLQTRQIEVRGSHSSANYSLDQVDYTAWEGSGAFHIGFKIQNQAPLLFRQTKAGMTSETAARVAQKLRYLPSLLGVTARLCPYLAGGLEPRGTSLELFLHE